MSPSGPFIVLAHKTKQNLGGRLVYVLTHTYSLHRVLSERQLIRYARILTKQKVQSHRYA